MPSYITNDGYIGFTHSVNPNNCRNCGKKIHEELKLFNKEEKKWQMVNVCKSCWDIMNRMRNYVKRLKKVHYLDNLIRLAFHYDYENIYKKHDIFCETCKRPVKIGMKLENYRLIESYLCRECFYIYKMFKEYKYQHKKYIIDNLFSQLKVKFRNKTL